MTSAEHEDERRRPDRRLPLPSGDSLFTPGAGPSRRAVERRSAAFLVWLHQRPRWAAPVTLGALFIAGLMAPGALGALCLLTVAVFFTWLAFLTWPALDRRQRVPRILMVAVLAVLAVARALGF